VPKKKIFLVLVSYDFYALRKRLNSSWGRGLMQESKNKVTQNEGETNNQMNKIEEKKSHLQMSLISFWIFSQQNPHHTKTIKITI